MRASIYGGLALILAVSAPARAEKAPLIPGLERLADAGNAEAIYHLGMAYQTGSGVTEDHAKALAAFRKAEALGDPLASYKLGCYFAGQGAGLVADDPVLALKYKLVAAEAGYSLAQFDVGAKYMRNGDKATAIQWLERSAAQGFAPALIVLSGLSNGAPGVPRDPARTAAYFRLAMAKMRPNPEQIAWITDFETKMTPEDRARANAIVGDYHAAPTPLTRKALAGQRTAEALVAGH